MIRYAVYALLLAPIAAFAADAGHGKQVFEQCAACHGADGKGSAAAPPLVGVTGRKAGSIEE